MDHKIENICSLEKLPAEEVIFFSVYIFLLAFFTIKIVS